MGYTLMLDIRASAESPLSSPPPPHPNLEQINWLAATGGRLYSPVDESCGMRTVYMRTFAFTPVPGMLMRRSLVGLLHNFAARGAILLWPGVYCTVQYSGTQVLYLQENEGKSNSQIRVLIVLQ